VYVVIETSAAADAAIAMGRRTMVANAVLATVAAIELSHPGFDAVLVPWLSGPEKETVSHGSSSEVFG
jgi:hypothetical protein